MRLAAEGAGIRIHSVIYGGSTLNSIAFWLDWPYRAQPFCRKLGKNGYSREDPVLPCMRKTIATCTAKSARKSPSRLTVCASHSRRKAVTHGD